MDQFTVTNMREGCGTLVYKLRASIDSDEPPIGFSEESIVLEDDLIKVYPVDKVSEASYTFVIETQDPGNVTAIAGPFELILK